MKIRNEMTLPCFVLIEQLHKGEIIKLKVIMPETTRCRFTDEFKSDAVQLTALGACPNTLAIIRSE